MDDGKRGRTRCLLLGFAALTTGCVERVIVEQTGGGASDSDSGESSTTLDDGEVSTTTDDEPEPTCQRPEDCPSGATCFEGVCVGTGELRVSLSWSYVSDLDLHVETPAGVHISFENPMAGGGVLDVDDCVGGGCFDVDGVHVENIFFPGQPPRGTYRVWVYNYDGRNGGPFQIEVSGATATSFQSAMAAQVTSSQVFTFDL